MLHSAFERIATLEDLAGLEAEGASGGIAPVVDPEERERTLRRAVFRARDLVSEAPADPQPADLLPSSIGAADRLLDGGLARGEVVEVVGRRSSGRFSLLLSLLAATTRAGESAALVDLGDQLDPQIAEASGVALERLLWLRPRWIKEALGATELLLQTGFVLVALDLGQPPVPGGRGADTFWVRLGRAARDHRGALLVSTPYRTSGSIAHAVLELRGAGARWQGRGRTPRLLEGLAARIERTRARGRLRGVDATAGRFALRSTDAALAVALAVAGTEPLEQSDPRSHPRPARPAGQIRPARRIEPFGPLRAVAGG